jgi:hypothetical protein
LASKRNGNTVTAVIHTVGEDDPSFAPFRHEPLEKLLDKHQIPRPFTCAPQLAMSKVHAREDGDAGAGVMQLRIMHKTDKSTVENYAAVLGFEELPAVLVVPINGTDEFKIVQGNHRFWAHDEMDRKTIAAYIIDVSDDVAASIALDEATMAALPLTQADKDALALYYLEQGESQAAVARRLREPVDRVAKVYNEVKWRKRLSRIGKDVSTGPYLKVSRSWAKYAPLYTIHDNGLFEKALDMSLALDLNTEEIRAIKDHMDALGDVTQEGQFLDEYARENLTRAQRRAAGAKTPLAVSNRRHLTPLIEDKQGEPLKAEQYVTSTLTNPERDVLGKDMTAVCKLAFSVVVKLDRHKAQNLLTDLQQEYDDVVAAGNGNGTKTMKRQSAKKAATRRAS